MEWSDRGLVLAKGIFREYDVWLRMLFRSRGVRTVFAFGGTRSRRRFVGCLDVLNELDCRVKLSLGGQYEELSEAVLARGPGALRGARASLGLAFNCLSLVDGARVTEESAPDCYRLCTELLGLLEKGGGDLPLFSLFFRLNFMGLLGYAPGLDECMGCLAPRTGGAFLCVEEGGVLCPACRRRRTGLSGAFLSGLALDTLQTVQSLWPEDWPALDLSPGDRRPAALCLDEMLRYHAGLVWDRGRFVKTASTRT